VSAERLYLVREELVPVEQLRVGDEVILPSGRCVTVETVDEYDHFVVVRWWRRAEQGEPGHRGGKNHADAIRDEWDGRYLGSLQPHQRGDLIRVARG
jgi:hypothetical protein